MHRMKARERRRRNMGKYQANIRIYLKEFIPFTALQGLILWERPAFALAMRRDNENFVSRFPQLFSTLFNIFKEQDREFDYF